MKKRSVKYLAIEFSLLLIPFIIYAIYKNGILIYEKNLISFISIFKPLFIILIGLIIKIIYDLIFNKKIVFDYSLPEVILLGLMMPYNISYLVYTVIVLISYILLNKLDKYIKFNKLCFVYLIIILINSIINGLSFNNILENSVSYSFLFMDLISGRVDGAIGTTCIIWSFIAYIILLFNFYYKKDIPFYINISYLLLAFIYYLIKADYSLLINSEIIFGSIFVASLPMYSPTSLKKQIIYGLLVGVLSFIVSIIFNKYIAIYLVIFILSLFNYVSNKK